MAYVPTGPGGLHGLAYAGFLGWAVTEICTNQHWLAACSNVKVAGALRRHVHAQFRNLTTCKQNTDRQYHRMAWARHGMARFCMTTKYV